MVVLVLPWLLPRLNSNSKLDSDPHKYDMDVFWWEMERTILVLEFRLCIPIFLSHHKLCEMQCCHGGFGVAVVVPNLESKFKVRQ